MTKPSTVQDMVANKVFDLSTLEERRAVAEEIAAYALGALIALDGQEAGRAAIRRIADAAARVK
jgi:hypothetical protein